MRGVWIARGGAVGLALWMGMASLAGAARAQFTSIVNGQQELAEPTTGALIQGDPDTGYMVCSVVLIGCDTAITTAHCFNSNSELKNWVYFQHAGFVPIASAVRHPLYAEALATYPPNLFDILRVEDIAVIHLAESVTGVTPSTLTWETAAPGTDGEIVGFGRDPITQVSAATGDRNVGIKRSGTIQLTACAGSLAGEDVLCWEPPVPQTVTGEDVNTCDGDSGGPLFVDLAGTRVVAGLTKGSVYDSQGQSDLCIPPIHPYDTNVDRHTTWLASEQTGVPFWTKQCSGLPQLDEDAMSGDAMGDCVSDPWSGEGARTCGFTGFLSNGQWATHSFDLPDGTALLRVAFNGIASPTAAVDTNFYLREGAPASPAQFDCKADGSGNVGFCEFVDPTPGIWYVRVEQDLYQGEYQVTVSQFEPTGPSASAPALGAIGGALLAIGFAAVGARAATRRGLPSTTPRD